MATIKAIEDRTVHQIQSGQVIVDLCSVVKELVENSLDAGATSIDVRFKNQGLDAIEVQDNGSGISPENYETVALKHHTSKLATYDDLTTLVTFGFRGEALSSLCALSKLTVTTCLASDAPKGTKLEFEQSGALKGTSVIAAQRGTTVSVEDLFYNLPVRRQELQRKIKTEWNKVVGVLGQYACIQTGVKIVVSQQTTAKARRTVLFSTKGNATTRENIVNVFGAKTLTALLPLDLALELVPTRGPVQRSCIPRHGSTKEVKIVGHISRPAYGEGRQTPDRQMFFVNSRPCGLPQVAKAFNEVYKSYNSSQSPFIFANIILDTHMYDVNVSPDKRTILLHDQTSMLEELKTSLTTLFESQEYTVPISQFPAQKQTAFRQLTIPRQSSTRSEIETSQSETPSSSEQLSEDSDHNEAASPEISIRSGGGAREKPNSQGYANEPAQVEAHGNSWRDDSGEGQAVNLMNDWLGKRTRNRAGFPDEGTSSSQSNGKAISISRDKQRLTEKLSKETSKQDIVLPSTQDTDRTNMIEVNSSATSPAFPSNSLLSESVGDFNALLGEAATHARVSALSNTAEDLAGDNEDAIPALTSPAKRMLPPSSPFITPARTRKGPEAVATITIGGHTATSSLRTPAPKCPRLENARTAASIAPVFPSFGNRLSQRFASGTQTPSDIEEELVTPGNGVLLSQETSSELSQSPKGQANPSSDISIQVETDSDTDNDDTDGAYVEEGSVKDDELLDDDSEYIDDEEKKSREDAKVEEMIKAAEEAATAGADNDKRANTLLNGRARRKDATLQLEQTLNVSSQQIYSQLDSLTRSIGKYESAQTPKEVLEENLDVETAEDKLSLTINKSDFAKMKIIGQFNLGFILAKRSANPEDIAKNVRADEDLFIIDQHASDEKYNFERLQNTTTVQSQRLVQPKTLDLTAVEEEIVMENLNALATNGFIITTDSSGTQPVGSRCQLVSLPLSKETTFSLADLEELISLLSETPPAPTTSSIISETRIVRPSKVRKMLAMRACRSSIMIGKTLNKRKMEEVVRHMGEIDKPWNCPHGRPTMRHLCGLGGWDETGWREGEGLGDDDEDVSPDLDWASWLRG